MLIFALLAAAPVALAAALSDNQLRIGGQVIDISFLTSGQLPTPQQTLIFSLIGFFAILGSGLFIFWRFRRAAVSLITHAFAHFGTELLRGLILFFILPIILTIVSISIIGLPLGIVGALLYLIVLITAKVFAGILLGGWLNRVFFKRPHEVFTLQTIVAGNVVLFALTLVPVIGGLVNAVFILVAFGALWGYLYQHLWMKK